MTYKPGMTWWRPESFAKKKPYLEARADILRRIRGFFDARGYLEVATPSLQTAPCMEAHIKGFKVERTDKYLHTSPEFAMKKLLVAGLPKIYQLARVYRNEAPSNLHTPEFTMLEWYQAGMDYQEMMIETVDLLRAVADRPLAHAGKTSNVHPDWEKITLVEALKKYAEVDISAHLNDRAYLAAEASRIGVYISDHDDWNNTLLKILMDKVEPHLGHPTPTILYDYPISMAALARAKPDNPNFAERFEVYICGVELSNGFGELTDARIQRARFENEIALRKKTYDEDYPIDEDFLKAIEHGLPDCSGNAVGVDRLVMLTTGAEDVSLVQI